MPEQFSRILHFLRSERAFPWRAFVIALVLRLVPVFLASHLAIGLDDMFHYDMLARSIVSGNGFRWYSEPDLHLIQQYFDLQVPPNYDPRGILTTFRAPLYPAFLALVYAFSGIGAQRFFAARLTQAFLNAALVPLTFFIAQKFASQNDNIARRAAWVVAFYPMFIIFPLALATENLFFVLFLAALLLLVKAVRAETPKLRLSFYVLSGFFFGLVALTRSVILPAIGLVALWVWFALKERKNAVLFLLAAVFTIAPWIIRNSLLTGHFTGIETSLGYNLYVGYHPQSTGSFTYGPSLDLLPILDDAERDKIGTQKALEFIRSDPGRVFTLAVSRLGHFFSLERRALIYFYSNNFFGFIPLPLLLLMSVLMFSPFIIVSTSAAFGLALIRWDRATLLLPLVLLAYLAPHILLLAEDRFHLTLVPLLAIFASICWDSGSPGLLALWNRSRAGKVALLLAGLVVFLLFFNWGYELYRDADKLALLFGPNGNITGFPY
jgi:hypothetical protein